MKTNNKLFIILIVATLVFGSLACGSSSNTGTKIGETGGQQSGSAGQEPAATKAPAQVQVYKVGDVIELNDHTIVLNSAEVKGNILHANFTIENKGSSDLAVSSIISFSAKDNEGTKLEQNIMDCGSAMLDGKVLPSDKVKGDICWNGATKLPVKIYYQANLLGSGAVVWEISQ